MRLVLSLFIDFAHSSFDLANTKLINSFSPMTRRFYFPRRSFSLLLTRTLFHYHQYIYLSLTYTHLKVCRQTDHIRPSVYLSYKTFSSQARFTLSPAHQQTFPLLRFS